MRVSGSSRGKCQLPRPWRRHRAAHNQRLFRSAWRVSRCWAPHRRAVPGPAELAERRNSAQVGVHIARAFGDLQQGRGGHRWGARVTQWGVHAAAAPARPVRLFSAGNQPIELAIAFVAEQNRPPGSAKAFPFQAWRRWRLAPARPRLLEHPRSRAAVLSSSDPSTPSPASREAQPATRRPGPIGLGESLGKWLWRGASSSADQRLSFARNPRRCWRRAIAARRIAQPPGRLRWPPPAAARAKRRRTAASRHGRCSARISSSAEHSAPRASRLRALRVALAGHQVPRRCCDFHRLDPSPAKQTRGRMRNASSWRV